MYKYMHTYVSSGFGIKKKHLRVKNDFNSAICDFL